MAMEQMFRWNCQKNSKQHYKRIDRLLLHIINVQHTCMPLLYVSISYSWKGYNNNEEVLQNLCCHCFVLIKILCVKSC
jgi:hypothetical protein